VAYFKASVQYGDWEGTAAADDADVGARSIERHLNEKKLLKPGEYLIATSLWVGENQNNKIDYVFVRAFLFQSDGTFASVQRALRATDGPIPVRVVKISLSLEEFVCLFKRFNVMLTGKNLSLEDREFSETEE
jgi:hypothetical protein